MSRDLTRGNPNKVIPSFIVPMLISVFFQQLYNMADSMIAGKYAGESALAAVGASYPITMLFMAVALGTNIGCSVVIAGLFGAKEHARMKTAIYTSFLAAGVLSVILSTFGIGFSTGIMKLIKTPVDIFEDSRLYLNIYIGGFIFVYLYNVATGAFNSMGDSRTPLFFLIGSSLGNIVLDIVFVKYFEWGVAGVAWATFIAQGIACILAMIALFIKLKRIETKKKAELFSKDLLLKITRIALPSIAQQSFISVGNVFVQRLINSFGSSVIAGYSASIKLNTFVITCLTTVGNGVSQFSSQNKGAGKTDRIKDGFKSGMKMALIIAVAFSMVLFFGREFFVNLFLDNDATEKALFSGMQFLMVVTPFYVVICMKLVADGVLRGCGAMAQFMIATFTDLILRVVLAYIFAGPMGGFFAGLGEDFDASMGIWMSWPVGWSIGALLSVIFYKQGKWKKAKIV
ncbi:MAG: MATE family efflux transporter [Lachnospiraceae bacterium]|nr:MATE family efflux transporter [Lachnospiraceae bacterium]